MYSPEIREPRQRERQTAAISPTYGDDDQSGQDKSPCSTHLHSRKTNFTCVCFQNVRLLLDGALVCTSTFFVGLIAGWLMGFLDGKDAERRDAWNRRNVVG